MFSDGSSTEGAIGILLVEDHTLMVDALTHRIEQAGGMRVVGHAVGVEESLSLYRRSAPDVVLCDVGLKGDAVGGIELTRRLTTEFHDARVLIYSGHTDLPLITQALDSGAAGYLRKTASRAELVDCLTAVASGETNVFDRATAADLVSHARRPVEAATGVDELTPRQREVLTRMVAGTLRTTQLAQEMQLSEATVKSHVEAILRRLDVKSRGEAVLLAVRQGLRP